MEFRGYRADDFEAMFALDEVCFAPEFRFSRAMMRRFAEAKKARVVIAEEDGLAGFCVVHLKRVEDGCVGYVVTLDVAAPWRRQGLAGELMRRVEGQVLEAGCGAMVLHVFVGNTGAIRFYERSGYVRSGRAVGFYGDGGDAWVYRKALARPTPE
jgi:ribosomal-protein-alanine N-acetyltransferase